MIYLKRFFKWILGILVLIGGVALVILRLKQMKHNNTENSLSQRENDIDSQISEIEGGLDKPVPDLSDSEVVDYWRNLK